MTNIELKVPKTDQNSCISVHSQISAQKQLSFNKKVGTVCELGKWTKKQLKIDIEKLKKVGTVCESQNFTKCLQKSSKKWFFDLAQFVIHENALKSSFLSDFELFGRKSKIHTKALFSQKSGFLSFLSSYEKFFDFGESRKGQSYRVSVKIEGEVRLDTPKHEQRFSENPSEKFFKIFFIKMVKNSSFTLTTAPEIWYNIGKGKRKRNETDSNHCH